MVFIKKRYSHNINNSGTFIAKFFCIGFVDTNNYDISNIPCSLQLIQPSEDVGLKIFFSPKCSGSIYKKL